MWTNEASVTKPMFLELKSTVTVILDLKICHIIINLEIHEKTQVSRIFAITVASGGFTTVPYFVGARARSREVARQIAEEQATN